MFFFKSCCSDAKNVVGLGSRQTYRVVSKNEKQQQNVRFFQSFDMIDKKCLASSSLNVLKIQKSQYEQQSKSLQGTDKKWIDQQFEPDQKSLGHIPNINNGRWVRLSDMLNKPALFDGKIQPRDIMQESTDCYFLSAVAALAQNQQHIKNVFGNQKFNKNGIYVVTLRINGVIKQILVDDFVPANNKGQPLFSKPNKNQFWLPILQKAWAKANRSYQNIISGNPAQIFKAVTYAPSLAYSIKQNKQQQQKIWKQIINNRKQNRPCCCQTDDQTDSETWEKIGLIPGQGYTLIQAAELINNNKKQYRILVLRNIHSKIEWGGEGNEKDQQFWKTINNTEQKQKILKYRNKAHDGIMFINYNDFCKYFSQIYFSLYQKGSHYFCQQFIPNNNISNCFTLKIQKKGHYILQLHQTNDNLKYQQSEQEQEYINRSTLIIAKRIQDNSQTKVQFKDQDFLFINGIMKYSQADTTLSVDLQPGEYILYTNFDPLRKNNQMPQSASISVYTKQIVNLYQMKIDKNIQNKILHRMFINHAKLNKRQTHNDDKMWISWKLLFQQGGFAYIAFGNSIDSDKKFVVTLHQSDFDEMNFQLVQKPLDKEKVLIVQPHEQLIILSKVKNLIFKGIKFPPQMEIKLEKVAQGN